MSVESAPNPLSTPDRIIVGVFEEYMSEDVSLMAGLSLLAGGVAAFAAEEYFTHHVFPSNPAHAQAEARITSLTDSETKVQSAVSLLKSNGNTSQANNLQPLIDSYKAQIASTRATMPANPHYPFEGATELGGTILVGVLVARGLYMAARHRYRKIATRRNNHSS